MRFEFATATRIVFGTGVVGELPGLVAGLGQRVLLVTGGDSSRTESTKGALVDNGVEAVRLTVDSEPSVDVASRGAELARAERCDVVLAVGGGSAIDAGKAIAALVANGGEPLDYLEVVGRARPLLEPSLPFVAVPTTAGTGAEVTRNAVLAVPAEGVKVSMRSAKMLPTLALVDPALTLSLPPAVTASTGLDALTQVLEPFVCKQANPMVDAFCRQGLRCAARSLRRAFEHGDDLGAREDMALCSLLGGLALANAKLGAAHGLAGPIGGLFPAPHGAVCARVLPAVMDVNVRALRDLDSSAVQLERYDELARLLTGRSEASAEDGVGFVQELCAALRVPGLASYGLGPEHLPDLVPKALSSSSMKGNPVQLSEQQVTEIVTRSL